MIWKLSQELKKKYDFYQEEFDKETRLEMNEWARLVDRYATELKKYVPEFGDEMKDDHLVKLENQMALANQKANNFILSHDSLIPTIKKINELLKENQGQ